MRPPKKDRNNDLRYENNNDTASDNNPTSDESEPEPPAKRPATTPKQPRKRRQKVDPSFARWNPTKDDGKDDNVEADASNMGFCCEFAQCHCPDSVKHPLSKDGKEFDPFIQTSRDSLWHRRCCHRYLKGKIEEFMPDMVNASYLACDPDELGDKGIPMLQTRTISEMKQIAKTDIEHHNNLVNEWRDMESEFVQSYTNSNYIQEHNDFKELCDKQGKSKCVFLDLFGGIGSGTVVMKKLGIAISHVIYCDYDKVATHVFKSNHDAAYEGTMESDGVEYTYIENIDNLYNNITDILEKTGPINVCFCSLPFILLDTNIQNKDKANEQTKALLLQFFALVTTINKHPLQQGQDMWFLAETTFLPNTYQPNIIEQYLTEVYKDFSSIYTITIDAKILSPTKGFKTYLTNLPTFGLNVPKVDSGVGVNADISNCINDAVWKPVAKHVKKSRKLKVVSKANLTVTRMKDIHTVSAKLYKHYRDNIYIEAPLAVEHKEKLMGWPTDYVTKPMGQLYTVLFEALAADTTKYNWTEIFTNKDNKKFMHFQGYFTGKSPTYKAKLDTTPKVVKESELANFVNIYEAKTEDTPMPVIDYFGFIQVKVANMENHDMLDKVDYSSILIGRASCIPVLELLMKPLQNIYQRKHYANFNYSYCWEE